MAYFESKFWHPSVATDAVILSLRENILSVLIAKRIDKRGWALPGGFIREGESLDECVRRELKEEAGIEVPYLKHFANYSEPQRDERAQTISVAYVAVHPSGKLKLKADTDVIDVKWVPFADLPQLAFDHNLICNHAVKIARKLIEEDPEIVFSFLPKEFTLTELQAVYAALGGKKFAPENKRNFRLWVDRYSDGKGLVTQTEGIRTGPHRPAKIYIPNPDIFGRN